MTEAQYDRERSYLDIDLEDGYITPEQHRQYVRELNEEMGPEDDREW